jgi:hypothetical protein
MARNEGPSKEALLDASRRILTGNPLHRNYFVVEMHRAFPGFECPKHDNMLIGPVYRDGTKGGAQSEFVWENRIYGLRGEVTEDVVKNAPRLSQADMIKAVAANAVNADWAGFGEWEDKRPSAVATPVPTLADITKTPEFAAAVAAAVASLAAGSQPVIATDDTDDREPTHEEIVHAQDEFPDDDTPIIAGDDETGE